MAEALRVAEDLATRARALDRYLRKMERLLTERSVLRLDVERAYGGGLLEFHVVLERSIERLFVGLLRRRLSHPSSAIEPLMQVASDIVAHNIIIGERRYVDWLPFERFTLKRATAFFASGRPFQDLTKSERDSFDALSTIRNALAHQSAAAIRQFERRFIDGKLIPPAQHRPSAYLRGPHTIGQTRMNYLLSEAVASMTKLCS